VVSVLACFTHARKLRETSVFILSNPLGTPTKIYTIQSLTTNFPATSSKTVQNGREQTVMDVEFGIMKIMKSVFVHSNKRSRVITGTTTLSEVLNFVVCLSDCLTVGVLCPTVALIVRLSAKMTLIFSM